MKVGAYVYRMFSENGELLYIGSTHHIKNRIKQHSSKIWFSEIFYYTLVKFPNRGAAFLAESIAIFDEQPKYNISGKSPAEISRVRNIKKGKKWKSSSPKPQMVVLFR